MRRTVPLQFGRDVAARLLSMPERAHWRDCALPKPKEILQADIFKGAFKVTYHDDVPHPAMSIFSTMELSLALSDREVHTEHQRSEVVFSCRTRLCWKIIW